MADFRRFGAAVQDTLGTVYTVPAGKVTIVIGAQATNVEPLATAEEFTLSWSDGIDTYTLLNAAEIPAETSSACLFGKLTLEAGDTLSAFCLTSDSVEFTLSVLELDA